MSANPVSSPVGQLPLYSVPDVRRDCSRRLAILLREVAILDDQEDGCFAGNEYFATKFLKCHPSTVRDLTVILEEHGLIERRVEHGRERHIRPLIPLEILFSQWRELALVCATCRRLGAALRAAARAALKLIRGSMAQFRGPVARFTSSKKTPTEPSISSEVRAFPAPKSAPLSSLERGREDEKASARDKRASARVPASPEGLQSLEAVASCLSAVLPESSAKALATLATRLKRTPEQVRQVVASFQARREAGQAIQNPGGYLRRLIEADPTSVGLPVASSTHRSELRQGERVRRVVVREEQLQRPVALDRTSTEPAPANGALAALRDKIGRQGGRA